MLEYVKAWARRIKADVVALYFAGRDPRTPWHAKAVAIAVAAYALSPIDLIPDFIPILGYLDDLIIVPLGIALAVRLIPEALLAELRATASARGRLPANWIGAACIVALWGIGLIVLAWWMVHRFW